jgi:large subunit ribosomal protein L16
MLVEPKRSEHRKVHRERGALSGKHAKGDLLLAFGEFGLKAVTPAEIDSRQIEAARKAINNSLRRSGLLWIRVFPHKSITKKAAEVPMGSGKGSPEKFVCPTGRGRIIFELAGVSEEQAKEAFRLAMHKLPCVCKFVTKNL